MRILPAIAANLFLVVAAIGFGALLRPLIPKTFSKLDRLAVVVLGGFGLLGTILFCVGQVWFSRFAIVLVLSAGALLSFQPFVLAVRERRSTHGKVFPLPVLPAGIILVVLSLTIVGGFALPTGDMNDDAIAYHYLGPKVWLREGVIRPVPDEVLTYFPVVVETQYAALMSLGGPRAPGFFSVVVFGSLLLTTASLALRLGLDPTSTWWAIAIVAGMPAVYRGVYGGYLDALFACFILVAVRLGLDAEEPGDFALFGIFCGILMGTKYTGIPAWGFLVFCSFLVLTLSHRQKTAFIVKWLVVSCVIAGVVASPFYLRNWILYGCPIYPPPPVLLRFFTVKNMSPAIMQELVKNVYETGRGMGGGIVNFFLLPFTLTYHTSNFRGAGGIGLVPLALGPFGILTRRYDNFTKGLLLFAVLQLATWFVTAQVSRYTIHLYVIGAILGVIGWNYVTEIAPRSGRLLSEVVIAISILYGLWMIVSARTEDIHAAVSSSFEAKRRDQETPHATAFDYINREPSVEKILIVDPNVAAYFIDKPFVKAFGRWGEQTVPGATTVPQVLALLPSLHATHLLDVEEGGSFALPSHFPGLTLVFEHGDQRIYRIN